jgi:hypothetical protein
LGFFFKEIIVISMKSMGHSPLMYMLLINYIISLKQSSLKKCKYIRRYIILNSSLLIPHFLDSYFHFTLQYIRAFLVFIYFLFRFDF